MKHSTIFSFLTRFFLLLLSHKINQKKKQESDPTVTNQKRRSSREKSQHAIEKIWWRFESYAYLFISMLVAVKAIKVQTSTFPIQHPNICRASVCIEANITWKSFFSRSKISGKYKQSKSTHTKKRTSQTQMQRKKEEEKKNSISNQKWNASIQLSTFQSSFYGQSIHFTTVRPSLLLFRCQPSMRATDLRCETEMRDTSTHTARDTENEIEKKKKVGR